MTNERREDERIPLKLPARYEGLSGGHDTRIDDLSVSGCFVNTRGPVSLGEIVSVDIELPSTEWIQLRGEIAFVQSGIGFGMVFSFLTDDEQRTLQQLVTHLAE